MLFWVSGVIQIAIFLFSYREWIKSLINFQNLVAESLVDNLSSIMIKCFELFVVYVDCVVLFEFEFVCLYLFLLACCIKQVLCK
jgi:hypothetical protein